MLQRDAQILCRMENIGGQYKIECVGVKFLLYRGLFNIKADELKCAPAIELLFRS